METRSISASAGLHLHSESRSGRQVVPEKCLSICNYQGGTAGDLGPEYQHVSQPEKMMCVIVVFYTHFDPYCLSNVKRVYSSGPQPGPSHCAAGCPWSEVQGPAVCLTDRLCAGRGQ